MSDQDKDPVVHSSLSKQLFFWSVLLVLSMAWGLYDEIYGIRPWKDYQSRFEKLYSRYLANARQGEAAFEKQIRSSPEYQKIDQDMQAAEKAAMPEASAIDKKVNEELVPKILALNDPFQVVRAHIGALTYEIEVSGSESHKNDLRKEIEGLKNETQTVAIPNPDGTVTKREMKFDEMAKQLQAWKDEKAAALQLRVEIMKAATDLRAKRDQYLADRLPIAAAVSTTGSRVVLTAAAMGNNPVFASHPD